MQMVKVLSVSVVTPFQFTVLMTLREGLMIFTSSSAWTSYVFSYLSLAQTTT